MRTKSFNGGKLFEDNVYLLHSNVEIDEWGYALLIRKLLLWSWLHNGAWLRWFHKCQLKYIINGKRSFSCESILLEYLPALYKLTCNIKENNYNEAKLIEWVNLRNLNISKNIYNVLISLVF